MEKLHFFSRFVCKFILFSALIIKLRGLVLLIFNFNSLLLHDFLRGEVGGYGSSALRGKELSLSVLLED